MKILIVGDKDVGKTSYILNYLNRDFSLVNDFNLTGVNWFRKIVDLNNSDEHQDEFIIDIWDIAGDDKFVKFIPCLTTFINGVILTFDSSSKESIDQLPHWADIISKYIPISVPWILVSLKNDLKKKLISKRGYSKEISNFIIKQNVKEYWPTSAITSLNVDKSFDKMLALIGIKF